MSEHRDAVRILANWDIRISAPVVRNIIIDTTFIVLTSLLSNLLKLCNVLTNPCKLDEIL